MTHKTMGDYDDRCILFKDLVVGGCFIKNVPFEGTISWELTTRYVYEKISDSKAIRLCDNQVISAIQFHRIYKLFILDKQLLIDVKLFEMIIKKFEEQQSLYEHDEDWEKRYNDIEKWLDKGKVLLTNYKSMRLEKSSE